MELISEYTEDPNEPKCKGLLFRGTISSFTNDKGHIGTKKYLKLLKRKSCPGCARCGWIMDFIHEVISEDPGQDYLEGIEDQKIYAPIITRDDEDIELDGWEEVKCPD